MKTSGLGLSNNPIYKDNDMFLEFTIMFNLYGRFITQVHQRKLNNESSEITNVLNMGAVAAPDCDELRMYQDAASTRASLEALHNA